MDEMVIRENSKNRPLWRFMTLTRLGPWVIAGLACLQLVPLVALAQDAPSAQVSMPQSSSEHVSVASSQGLTLQDAVQRALTSYPTVRIALERVLAARANVGLTRAQYLPQVNLLWQTNRSTYNNIAGLLMPQGVVPSLSGPVLANTSGTSVWGSAGGLLVNWEPTRFGYRNAEVAASRTRLIQVQTLEKVNLAALAELLGLPSRQILLDAEPLLAAPSNLELATFAATAHPSALEQSHLWGQAQAQQRVWSRAYLPRFSLEGSVSGRSSGVQPDGTLLEGTNGLGPDRENWAVGIQATFAAFDYFSIREQKKIAAANERAQQLNYQNTIVSLNTQVEQARAQLEGAMQTALNTPVQLAAARAAESQARARYQAGLANIAEATQALALLQQAEAQDVLARIGVWQTLLGISAAQGDLTPFLRQLSGAH